jgi:metal-responsive CopG/Arc/MetJ family transcriptional regulator
MRTTRRQNMPASTKPTKPPVRSIQVALPADFIATIDRIASRDLQSRSAWMRRVLNNAVRAEHWRAELNKPR